MFPFTGFGVGGTPIVHRAVPHCLFSLSLGKSENGVALSLKRVLVEGSAQDAACIMDLKQSGTEKRTKQKRRIGYKAEPISFAGELTAPDVFVVFPNHGFIAIKIHADSAISFSEHLSRQPHCPLLRAPNLNGY